MTVGRFLLLGFLTHAIVAVTVVSSDHGPLQELCVGDSANPTFVNGLACVDLNKVQANDFFFSGLHQQGNTSNAVGSKVTPVTVVQIPGLNTQGLTMFRIDFAPQGINPPHSHPRATEMLTLLKGSIEVGFVTSNPNNSHMTRREMYSCCQRNAIALAALTQPKPWSDHRIFLVMFWQRPSKSIKALFLRYNSSSRQVLLLNQVG